MPSAERPLSDLHCTPCVYPLHSVKIEFRTRAEAPHVHSSRKISCSSGQLASPETQPGIQKAPVRFKVEHPESLPQLGALDGDNVGATVGSEAVGEADGEAVGEVVGEAVGEVVGLSVGEIVGEAVGARVANGVGENVLVALAMFGTIGLPQLTFETVTVTLAGSAAMAASAAESTADAMLVGKVNWRMSELSVP